MGSNGAIVTVATGPELSKLGIIDATVVTVVDLKKLRLSV